MAKEELKSALYFFNNISFRDSEEMINLALACNYQLVDGLLQNVKVVNKSYYFGKGKVEEFKTLLNEIKMPEDTPIILNVEVSGTQKRNLEEVLGLRIIDRTELILNIFESRAKTTEAKLQVEIAKLHYLSSKLVDEKANYSQVTSGTGHNKGKGETNKELSQREILSAIKRKEKQLENIKKSRKTGRNLRNSSSIPVVAVVGYTNAGKSTLVNSLINFSKKKPSKNVLEKDMLFATLETSSRLIDVYNYPSFIISDTVGFVSRLPYYLIAAFRSTLEEIKEADYIIHVIDASSKYYDIEMEVTNFILEELDAANIPMIKIYNKADLVANDFKDLESNEILVSLNNPLEIEGVFHFLISNIASSWIKKTITVPLDFDFREFSKDNYVVAKINKKDGIAITVYFNPLTKYKYQNYFSN